MRELLPAPETVEDLTAKLVCSTMVWAELRDRSLRCGDRDAQLLQKRDRAMAGIDLLLDKYVMAQAFETGVVEVGREV